MSTTSLTILGSVAVFSMCGLLLRELLLYAATELRAVVLQGQLPRLEKSEILWILTDFFVPNLVGCFMVGICVKVWRRAAIWATITRSKGYQRRCQRLLYWLTRTPSLLAGVLACFGSCTSFAHWNQVAALTLRHGMVRLALFGVLLGMWCACSFVYLIGVFLGAFFVPPVPHAILNGNSDHSDSSMMRSEDIQLLARPDTRSIRIGSVRESVRLSSDQVSKNSFDQEPLTQDSEESDEDPSEADDEKTKQAELAGALLAHLTRVSQSSTNLSQLAQRQGYNAPGNTSMERGGLERRGTLVWDDAPDTDSESEPDLDAKGLRPPSQRPSEQEGRETEETEKLLPRSSSIQSVDSDVDSVGFYGALSDLEPDDEEMNHTDSNSTSSFAPVSSGKIWFILTSFGTFSPSRQQKLAKITEHASSHRPPKSALQTAAVPTLILLTLLIFTIRDTARRRLLWSSLLMAPFGSALRQYCNCAQTIRN
eukprot:g2840.t1